MSLLPFFIESSTPSCNNFGLGLRPRDFWISPLERSLIRSMCDSTDMECDVPKSHVGEDGFQVSMDVQHFHPNEITVKTVDNSVIVEAKHEEKRDEHGYISRQFIRRYDLPKGFKAEDVISSLSSDGVLTVKAAPPKAIEGNTRSIQIQQTGPARTNVNNNEKAKEATNGGKK